MKIAKWRDFPDPLKLHIQQRVRERKITIQDLQRLEFWVRTDPEIPEGDWFKDFGSFKICGTGAYPKTILESDMTAFGTEL